jgi:PAS domain S-box-containing protein
MNQNWFDYSGLTWEQLRGWNWTSIVHPKDFEKNLTLWKEALKTGTQLELEHRFLRKDRVYRWHLTRAKSMCDDAGKIKFWVGTNTDIHDQKMAEQSLLDVNKELEQFAYVASHDLKAPLRGIGNLADWIEEDLKETLTPKTSQYMNMLHVRLRRMNNLIDGILQYSRAGRANIEKEKIKTQEVVRDVWELIPPHKFKLKLANDLPVVCANKTIFGQVFSNLLGNAVKHHTNGDTGVIEVGFKDIPDNMVEFYVKDDGPGIDPLFYNKIFGMFQTPVPKDDTENTGVGLAICKRIVEQNGGKIWFESKLKEGSTFFFTWKKPEETL